MEALAAGQGTHVLIVDDDVEIANAMQEILEMDGYGVTVAHDGRQALEVLRTATHLPDAIVLDLRMPQMDGWTFRAEQRRDPVLGGIPVLVMSADLSPQAEAIDAAAFLPKPTDMGAVLSEVRRVIEDARRQRKAERDAHTERLASLGRLAAGVAHEINNPLAWITANLRLLQERLPGVLGAARAHLSDADREGAEELPQMVSESLEGARRIAEIVQQVKSFSRPQGARREPVDVAGTAEAALKMVELQARHHVTTVRRLGATPPVMADATQLSQLFLNLILNAADAVAATGTGVGTVTVTTATDEDDHVVFEVEDTGVGMSAATRERMFDPFFTTKPVGKGTGLGLFLCHGIVSALDGDIQVESEPGQGTTVRVRIPAMGEAAEADPRRSPGDPEGEEEAARRTVLVVEDEQILLRALQRMLKSRYEVRCVQSVDAAVRLLEAGAEVDAILCDIHMPQKGGPELQAVLQNRWPRLAERTVFMTGGGISEASQAFIDTLNGRCLSKPLDPDALHAALARLGAAARS